MNILSTDKAPGAIGPYSQGYEVNGVVYTSGQIPVDPTDGTVAEGIAALPRLSRAVRMWEQSWRQPAPDLTRCLRPPVSWLI